MAHYPINFKQLNVLAILTNHFTHYNHFFHELHKYMITIIKHIIRLFITKVSILEYNVCNNITILYLDYTIER